MDGPESIWERVKKSPLALMRRLIRAYDSKSGESMVRGFFNSRSGTFPNAFSSDIRAAAPNARARYFTNLALILGCLAFAVPGCSVTSWKSALGRNHPLTGRIWDVSSARFMDRQSLFTRLARADFLLLGERHDNPDHHLLQAEVLRSLIAAGRRPAVGFEMFGLDDASAIADHLAAAPNDAAGLGRAANWNERGWPDWAMYQPIAQVALEAKLRIVSTNLPLDAARMMRKAGLAALDPRVTRALGLDRPLSESLSARLAADVRASHCGYASEENVKAMVAVQRARDAQMAQSLIAAGDPDGAVLVAGAGHVRSDYGIPIYLTANAAGKRVISIAFLEVDDQKPEPNNYALPYANGRLPFDYVWFTPRVDDENPCEKFKSQFERLKRSP
ncbi:MAG TPA: ChaN family lipoprotein [Candidatus Binatia bacterium]|nr:ChaN family lipoprotein [Candidatus Binatia bacterium]